MTKIVFKYLSALLLILALIFSLALVTAGHWLDLKEKPSKSDFIVILASDPRRAIFAADLYQQHFAKKILISRPVQDDVDLILKQFQIAIPSDEEIDALILVKKKVPKQDYDFFGTDSISTVQEAISLQEYLLKKNIDPHTTRLLIVTSPYHTFRSKIIFRQTLKNNNIAVVSTPYEKFAPNWWTHQSSARNVILELSKLTFYFLGGRYFSH